jgi:FtsP/CotA-like multicopper oxidase with cupredoxin domain
VYNAERYLILDDIRLDEDGQIWDGPMPHPDQVHGRHGNVLLTNGVDSTTLVESAKQGEVEHWRVVNTANARTMVLGIEGAKMRIIGTDGGLLTTPYVQERVLLPVGQRYELQIDYTDAGTVVLNSYVPALDDNNNLIEVAVPVFTVEVEETGEAPRVISRPVIEELIAERAANRTEVMEFDGINGDNGIEWRINGVAHSMEPLFSFDTGDTVEITLRNLLGQEHPFHLHGQFFRVLDDSTQPGLKDTVLLPGGSEVKIVAYMDNPGNWMAHCHILEHAELGMMATIDVK